MNPLKRTSVLMALFVLGMTGGCARTRLFDHEMKNSLNGPNIQGHWQWRHFDENGDLVSVGELRLKEKNGMIQGMSIPKSPSNNFTRLRRLPIEGNLISADQFEITSHRLIEDGDKPVLLKAVSIVQVAPNAQFLRASCEQQFIDNADGQIKTYNYNWDAVPLPADQEEAAQKARQN